jgi:hypothetical protein
MEAIGGNILRELDRLIRLGLMTVICAASALAVPASWAIKLGPGSLDLSAGVGAILDDNVNYSSANTEEAVEAQVSPGIAYRIPFGYHSFELGYHGTLLASKKDNANSLRQSPYAALTLDFPGGLGLSFRDRFDQVHDTRQPELEELNGPDFVENQAYLEGNYSKSGVVNASAYYQNTLYRYETRADERNSDGNVAGATVAVPISPRVAILTIGEWGNEKIPELSAKNYRSYNVMGGLRFSGAARFDLDVTAGYQAFDYYEDPNEVSDEGYSVQAALSAGITSNLKLEMTAGSDVRSSADLSGSVEFFPRTQTSMYLNVTRGAQRSFFQDYKYYVITAADFLVSQRVLQTTSLYAKVWYSLLEYKRSAQIENPQGASSDPRKDTFRGWRIGMQYEIGSWVELGLYGESQQRDSNFDLPFGEYKRTVIGANATIHSPL